MRADTAGPAALPTRRSARQLALSGVAVALVATLFAACGGGSPAATVNASLPALRPLPPASSLGPLVSSVPVATSAPNATAAPVATVAPSASEEAPASDAGSGPPVVTGGAICRLVTVEEIAAIVGSTVSITEGDETSCTWTTGQFNGINLRLEQTGSTDIGSYKLAFPGGRDVPGIGDSAYWAPSVQVLYATYKGNTYAVQLVLFAGDDAKNLQVATTILQKALSRI